jgi:hypothetical protein
MPGLPPDQVAALLTSRAGRLRAEIDRVEAMHAAARAQGLHDLFLIESIYRVHLLTAELDFVARLAHDIGSGAIPGTNSWQRIHELRADGVSIEEIFADPVRHLGEEGRALLPPDHAN